MAIPQTTLSHWSYELHQVTGGIALSHGIPTDIDVLEWINRLIAVAKEMSEEVEGQLHGRKD
jgi:hypothetical protein